MMHIKLSIFAVLALTCLSLTSAQQLTYDERCQILEGNGVRVDQCDSSKRLACKDGRCQCSDPVNQIYTYREEAVNSRSKRSPGKKGGGFKKVAIGAGAGAVAGVATYQISKGLDKGFSTGSSSGDSRRQRTQKVYGCFSRVGGQCALNYNNWQSVSGTNATSTTTTEHPTAVNSTETPSTANATSAETVTVHADNATTTSTTAAPSAAPQTQVDVSKIPTCIQYAQCKSGPPSGTNGTSSYLQKVNYDPRVGICECNAGYKRTTKDICVRDKSGAGKTAGISTTVILAAILFNKILSF